MQHNIRTEYRNNTIKEKVDTIINLISEINENIIFDNTIVNHFKLIVNNEELIFHTYPEVINALRLVKEVKNNAKNN